MIRQANVTTQVYFPLIKRGVMDFATGSDYSPASGDVKISIDGATAVTATNNPSAVTMGNGAMWKLVLDSTELDGSVIVVTIIDASSKAIEDQMLVIETYAIGTGQFDLNDLADATLARDLAEVGIEADRSLLNAVRFLRNKWSISGATLTVTKEDDTASAWTSTLATTGGANPVTSSDPA